MAETPQELPFIGTVSRGAERPSCDIQLAEGSTIMKGASRSDREIRGSLNANHYKCFNAATISAVRPLENSSNESKP